MPAARCSKTGATTTTPCCFASAAMASVVGPGSGSASSKSAGSSTWQKYGEANSSGRTTICAPRAAASAIARRALATLAALSRPMAIWTRPSLSGCGDMPPKLAEGPGRH